MLLPKTPLTPAPRQMDREPGCPRRRKYLRIQGNHPSKARGREGTLPRTDAGSSQHGDRHNQEGSALMVALVFVAIVLGAVLSHSTELAAHKQKMQAESRLRGLADTIAQSGVTDATEWFRRQNLQPVQVYEPKRDLDATPPLLETQEQELGLVREFQIQGELWGRYEVRKDEVMDVSELRGADGAGHVWDLASRGILYHRPDPDTPFDTQPNKVLAVTALRTELRGIGMTLPAAAAVILPSPAGLNLQPGHVISGGNAPAFAFDAASRATDSMPPQATLATGTPLDTTVANLDLSPTKIFAMRVDELALFADIAMEDATPDVFRTELRDKILYSTKDLTLASGQSLSGRVLLIVDGDLDVQAGNQTKIEGIVIATGDVALNGPFQLDGTLLCGGQLELGTGQVGLHYDAEAIAALRSALSHYRSAPPVPAIPSAPGIAWIDSENLQNGKVEAAQSSSSDYKNWGQFVMSVVHSLNQKFKK